MQGMGEETWFLAFDYFLHDLSAVLPLSPPSPFSSLFLSPLSSPPAQLPVTTRATIACGHATMTG